MDVYVANRFCLRLNTFTVSFVDGMCSLSNVKHAEQDFDKVLP